LTHFIVHYGLWFLFGIVCLESAGLWVPGETALIAAGVYASKGHLSITAVIVVAAAAAIIGDNIGYWLGRELGRRLIYRYAWIKRIADRVMPPAERFFERHGGKAVVLGRFVPIVRTFVPFVAGAGSMRYSSFITYNILGGLAWVAICVGAGYAFGNVPVVRDNFSLVAIGIVAVSVLPMVVEYVRGRRRRGTR
jgi:membrane-associated protein